MTELTKQRLAYLYQRKQEKIDFLTTYSNLQVFAADRTNNMPRKWKFKETDQVDVH
jgi:hypothetical protein